MAYRYDPINKILVKTKDEDRSKLNSVLPKDMRKQKEHNPLDYRIRLQKLGYRPEVINKEMRSYSDGAGYADLKETKDSKTKDYSYQDASKVFSYLDKEVQRDLVNYSKTLQNADTPKKCEELEQIIRDLMEDYMDEYLGIWNQVGQYAQDKRKQTQQLFSTLMAQCFKKYNELKRAGK